jgi:hypothetical protein
VTPWDAVGDFQALQDTSAFQVNYYNEGDQETFRSNFLQTENKGLVSFKEKKSKRWQYGPVLLILREIVGRVGPLVITLRYKYLTWSKTLETMVSS